jgi:CBS domain-containing protein
MDVSDIVDEKFRSYDDSTPVSKLRGAFETTDEKALLITRDGEFEGVVSRREVLSSHEKGSRKARSLVRPVPTIDRHEDLREAARLMIAGDTKVLPVFDTGSGDDDGNLVGVVREDDLLEHVQPFLSVLDVEDVATTDVVAVNPETTLGQALATFRTERIRHLPVVNGADEVVGIVGLVDLLEFVTRELQRSQGGDPSDHVADQGAGHGGFGAREGESADLLDLPVRNVMIETVGTATATESLDDVLETMLESGTSSSIVLDDGVLAGIVTKTDLLESLTWADDDALPVQVFGGDLLSDLTREELGERIENVTRKYRSMRVMEAKVHFDEHKERLRGVPRIYTRIRLFTDKGLFIGEDAGFGDRHSFSLALNAVERQILEGKTFDQSKKPADTEEIHEMYGWWLSE